MKITYPTLLLDEKKCRSNLLRMLKKANIQPVSFRPHFKTHQSAQIGEWFREAGVEKITVSSVGMAEYFAAAGWKDILVAFPVNILEIDQINQLASKIKLSLLVESIKTIEFLAVHLDAQVDIYIKIDTGYHRTGIEAGQEDIISGILDVIHNSSFMNFTGFLTHAGNTYQAKYVNDILNIHKESVQILKTIRQKFNTEFPEAIISIGDTPSCSLVSDFSGIDEIRPGNFIFYDVMQQHLGSCSFAEIAVAVMCPVVAIHKSRNEIVIHGGAVHLSKEFITNDRVEFSFGSVVIPNKTGWSEPIENTFVKSLSQEHGIIKCTDTFIDQIRIGDVIGILPVHSCLTANLYPHYVTFDSKKIDRYHQYIVQYF